MHNSLHTAHSNFSAKAEDKETAELSTRWTLRKQAALLLDTVALSFPPTDVLTAGKECCACVLMFILTTVIVRIAIRAI